MWHRTPGHLKGYGWKERGGHLNEGVVALLVDRVEGQAHGGLGALWEEPRLGDAGFTRPDHHAPEHLHQPVFACTSQSRASWGAVRGAESESFAGGCVQVKPCPIAARCVAVLTGAGREQRCCLVLLRCTLASREWVAAA